MPTSGAQPDDVLRPTLYSSDVPPAAPVGRPSRRLTFRISDPESSVRRVGHDHARTACALGRIAGRRAAKLAGLVVDAGLAAEDHASSPDPPIDGDRAATFRTRQIRHLLF